MRTITLTMFEPYFGKIVRIIFVPFLLKHLNHRSEHLSLCGHCGVTSSGLLCGISTRLATRLRDPVINGSSSTGGRVVVVLSVAKPLQCLHQSSAFQFDSIVFSFGIAATPTVKTRRRIALPSNSRKGLDRNNKKESIQRENVDTPEQAPQTDDS